MFGNILEAKKFEKFEEILEENPNVINSMRGEYKRTFLMEAVEEKRFDIFNELMKFPQDFSLVDEDGQNILHWVGWSGDVRHLQMLEEKTTIESLINEESNIKFTPLHYAAWNNNHDVIRWLLQKGANPEAKNSDGERPDEFRDCDDVTKEIIRSFRSSW